MHCDSTPNPNTIHSLTNISTTSDCFTVRKRTKTTATMPMGTFDLSRNARPIAALSEELRHDQTMAVIRTRHIIWQRRLCLFPSCHLNTTKIVSLNRRCFSSASLPPSKRTTSLARSLIVVASSEGNADDTEPSPSPSEAQGTWPGSSIALPAGVRTAGAVFVLAGFLKLLIICFPYSTMAVSMYLHGRADLGVVAAIKMIPMALGILVGAKVLVDRKLHERKWFVPSIVACSAFALVLSRFLFARPRRSPLDPLMKEYRYSQRAVEHVEAMQQRGMGRTRSLQPSEEARQKLLEKSNDRNERFDASETASSRRRR